VVGYLAAQNASRQLKKFSKKLPQSRTVQHKLLLQIIRANESSDFGKKHNYARIKSYNDFTEALPLCGYQYFQEYIDRCRKGQTTALFGPSQQLLMFALTSGTTTPAKYIPVTQEFAHSYRRGWNIWGVKALSDHPDSTLRKILPITGSAQQHRSESSLPCGSISGMLARDQKYIVRQFYATPYEVANIADVDARYYTIMRFALMEDIAFISTANPSTTLKLAQTGERNAHLLIKDIHDGTLNAQLPIPGELHQQLSRQLKKNHKRADELEEILSRQGRLLPKDYWELSFLANWTGGAVALYLPQLSEYYGSIPIRDIGLLASEGRISIPMADNTPEGVLDIYSNFFEFVRKEEYEQLDHPENCVTIDSSKLSVYQCCQLEKGKEYYIFLTNYAGLYRYNLGDLIRVNDHIGTTPVIEFLSRGAHISSITGEKLSEYQVVNSVRAAASEMAIPLVTFVMAPQWDDPPRYRLYLGCRKPLPGPLLQQFGQMIDQRLMLANMEYESKRDSNRLNTVEVRQIPVGFLLERDLKIIQANQGRNEQFKHRFLHNEPLEWK